ncbi:MAG: zinc-ribbon and DUF3426 domain-containing protein [Xanthomonadales bacterium]
MYTRCPCHTVHPVNALVLAQVRGKYRCGKCKQISNALESLFDQWPDPGDHPPAAGKLPLLGFKLDLAAAKQARLSSGEASSIAEKEGGADQGAQRGKKTLRAAWIAAAIALLILVTVYLAEFFQLPLLDSSGFENLLVKTALKEPSPTTPWRDLDQVQLLSRDMRSHPTRPDTLSLSLTIVNRASRSQAFPKLEVDLLDSSGQTLVSRLFEPDEYLAEGTDIETGMTPQAYLHISLDLADPGHQAVGFELHFR